MTTRSRDQAAVDEDGDVVVDAAAPPAVNFLPPNLTMWADSVEGIMAQLELTKNTPPAVMLARARPLMNEYARVGRSIDKFLEDRKVYNEALKNARSLNAVMGAALFLILKHTETLAMTVKLGDDTRWDLLREDKTCRKSVPKSERPDILREAMRTRMPPRAWRDTDWEAVHDDFSDACSVVSVKGVVGVLQRQDSDDDGTAHRAKRRRVRT